MPYLEENKWLTLAENAYLGSGKGIYFDGQTTSANFLDDYEEGTWTPTVAQGTIASYGFYAKIGGIVHVSGVIYSFSDRSSSQPLKINNLPFNANTGNGFSSSATIGIYRFVNITGTELTGYIPGSGTDLEFWSSAKNAGYSQVQHSNLSATNATIYWAATYRTS